MRKLLTLLGLLWVLPAVAQFPISKLPPATLPLSGAEIVPMTQLGATKQTAISNIFAVAPPLAASFLLEAPNALIPNSRTLAGTANEVILTDGGALGNLTLSTPQAIGTASNVTFASAILGTPLTAPNGGTGLASYTIGDLLTAASSTSLTQLSDVATGSYLRSKGVATAPGWSVVTLPNLDTLGDTWYASAANTMTALSGNTTATKNFLTQTGNGSVSAAPAWGLLALTDVPPINLGITTNGGVLSTSILPGANGGTANGFFAVTGPATSLKTFTLPNASATILTTNADVTVPQGGTGLATLPVHGVLLGEATSNVGNVAAMAADTLLQGQGTGNDPAAVAVNSCSATSSALTYSTSTHGFGCNSFVTTSTTTITLPFTTAGANCSANGTNGTLILRAVGNIVEGIITASGTCNTAATTSLNFSAGTIPAGYQPVHGNCGAAIVTISGTLTAAEICVSSTGVLNLDTLGGTGTSFGLIITTAFTYGLD